MSIMDKWIGRAVRIVAIAMSVSLATSWFLQWYSFTTWILVVVAFTGYCDLIVERLSKP